MPYWNSKPNRGTSTYFNNYGASNQQDLLESLNIEVIRQVGENMLYVPRKLGNKDQLYTEDDQSIYDAAYPIEMYIKSVDGFGGEGEVISSFGYQILNQVTFTVARRVFEEEIAHKTGQPRPNEGDLVYFPLNGRLFQVLFVDYKPFFYQLGKVYTWDITCGNFKYSSEVFSTGYSEIDSIAEMDTDMYNYALTTDDGLILTTEDGEILVSEDYDFNIIDPDDDSQAIQFEAEHGVNVDKPTNEPIIDFSESNPFSEKNY